MAASQNAIGREPREPFGSARSPAGPVRWINRFASNQAGIWLRSTMVVNQLPSSSRYISHQGSPFRVGTIAYCAKIAPFAVWTFMGLANASIFEFPVASVGASTRPGHTGCR